MSAATSPTLGQHGILRILPGNDAQDAFFLARHDRRGARLPDLLAHPIFAELKNRLGGGMKTRSERDALARLANTLNSYGYSDLAIWIALGV